MKMMIRAHVCDVRKPLISISDMVKAGHKVVFDTSGSYMFHKATGTTNEVMLKNGVYVLEVEMIPCAQSQGN